MMDAECCAGCCGVSGHVRCEGEHKCAGTK